MFNINDLFVNELVEDKCTRYDCHLNTICIKKKPIGLRDHFRISGVNNNKWIIYHNIIVFSLVYLYDDVFIPKLIPKSCLLSLFFQLKQFVIYKRILDTS